MEENKIEEKQVEEMEIILTDAQKEEISAMGRGDDDPDVNE